MATLTYFIPPTPPSPLSIPNSGTRGSRRWRQSRLWGRSDVHSFASARGVTLSSQSQCSNLTTFEKTPAFPTVFDINQIQHLLPHRYPFLLVDRVVEFTPGVSAVGIKHLTVNESFFAGHFPGNPIMPGVLILEAMTQLGGIILLQPEVGFCQDRFLFLGASNVKFRKKVSVGDTLIMKTDLTMLKPINGYIAKMHGKAYVGGELVCEGDMMVTGELINKEYKSELLKGMELTGKKVKSG